MLALCLLSENTANYNNKKKAKAHLKKFQVAYSKVEKEPMLKVLQII